MPRAQNHGIIFTGINGELKSEYSNAGWAEYKFFRTAGPNALRTFLKKSNYNVRIIDFTTFFSDDEIIELISQEAATSDSLLFVGFSLTFFSISHSLYSKIRARFPKLHILVGGQWLPLNEIAAGSVDFAFIGNAEIGLKAYLDWRTGKSEKPKTIYYPGVPHEVINCLHDYNTTEVGHIGTEWEDEDFIKPHMSLPLEISRGCIFKCAFCAFPNNGRKKSDYIRSIDSIMDEVKRNYDRWGTVSYHMSDDTFNDSMEKIETLANAIAKLPFQISYSAYIRADMLHANKGMASLLAQTGLVGANIGVESINAATRRTIGKGMDIELCFEAMRNLKSAKKNLWVTTNLIVGLPGDSLDAIYAAHERLQNIRASVTDRIAWHPLAISKNIRPWKNLSQIDQNPEKFGYTTFPIDQSDWLGWKNEHMDLATAYKTVREFMHIEEKRPQAIGGWHVASLINAAYTIEEISKGAFDARVMNLRMLDYVNEYKKFQLSR